MFQGIDWNRARSVKSYFFMTRDQSALTAWHRHSDTISSANVCKFPALQDIGVLCKPIPIQLVIGLVKMWSFCMHETWNHRLAVQVNQSHYYNGQANDAVTLRGSNETTSIPAICQVTNLSGTSMFALHETYRVFTSGAIRQVGAKQRHHWQAVFCSNSWLSPQRQSHASCRILWLLYCWSAHAKRRNVVRTSGDPSSESQTKAVLLQSEWCLRFQNWKVQNKPDSYTAWSNSHRCATNLNSFQPPYWDVYHNACPLGFRP